MCSTVSACPYIHVERPPLLYGHMAMWRGVRSRDTVNIIMYSDFHWVTEPLFLQDIAKLNVLVFMTSNNHSVTFYDR